MDVYTRELTCVQAHSIKRKRKRSAERPALDTESKLSNSDELMHNLEDVIHKK